LAWSEVGTHGQEKNEDAFRMIAHGGDGFSISDAKTFTKGLTFARSKPHWKDVDDATLIAHRTG
jgi:hypothetical protein